MTGGYYSSPIGRILVSWENRGLTGVWFVGQQHFPADAVQEAVLPEPVKTWLDLYFSGEIPTFLPKLYLMGTPFQVRVWERLLEIPYGQTTTYGALAEALGMPGASRAVGAAVGRNPISLIVPCHRVIGKGKRLTGYAGGIHKKEFLLKLEGFLD